MTFINRCFGVVEKISTGVNALAKFLLVAFVTVMVLTTTAQIFCRYVLNSALIWPEELNVFLMAWVTFIGSSIALRNMEHIGVNLFVDMLPNALNRVIKFFGKLVIAYFLLFIIQYGFNVALMSYEATADSMKISMFWPRFSLVVGGLMMLIQTIYLLMADLKNLFVREEVK